MVLITEEFQKSLVYVLEELLNISDIELMVPCTIQLQCLFWVSNRFHMWDKYFTHGSKMIHCIFTHCVENDKTTK